MRSTFLAAMRLLETKPILVQHSSPIGWENVETNSLFRHNLPQIMLRKRKKEKGEPKFLTLKFPGTETCASVSSLLFLLSNNLLTNVLLLLD